MRQIYCRHAERCCFLQRIYTEQSENMQQSRFKLQVTPRSPAQMWNFSINLFMLENAMYCLLYSRLLCGVFPVHRADCEA